MAITATAELSQALPHIDDACIPLCGPMARGPLLFGVTDLRYGDRCLRARKVRVSPSRGPQERLREWQPQREVVMYET